MGKVDKTWLVEVKKKYLEYLERKKEYVITVMVKK